MTYAKSLLASAAVLLVSSSAHAEVVINELLHVSGGATDFVELYNNGTDAVDIGGWTLHAGTRPSTTTVRATVPTGTMLAPGGYWLFSRATDADAGASDGGVSGQVLAAALPAASNTDGVLLQDGSTVIDTVLFGSPNEEGWVDDKGLEDGSDAGAASFAPKWPSGGRSIGRQPNGVDTNECGVDFVATPAGQNTPGAANYEAPPVPDAGPSSSSSSSSSGSSGQSSSSGGRSSSSSSGGRSSSSSSGSRSDGGMNSEGDDDDDNSNLAADDGGCSMGATGAPMPFLIGLGALLVIRRRRLARKP